MTRQRLEIGLALAVTLIAFLFVAMAVWAEQATSVAVTQAWARPTIGEGRVTAAYVTIKNVGTGSDRLVSVSSPKAAQVEIHETKMTDDGVMKMRPIGDGLPIPAGDTVSMKPGGVHIMVMGLKNALPKGETLPLTLDFEKAGAVELSVPVGAGASGSAGKTDDAGGHDHSHH